MQQPEPWLDEATRLRLVDALVELQLQMVLVAQDAAAYPALPVALTSPQQRIGLYAIRTLAHSLPEPDLVRLALAGVDQEAFALRAVLRDALQAMPDVTSAALADKHAAMQHRHKMLARAQVQLREETHALFV